MRKNLLSGLATFSFLLLLSCGNSKDISEEIIATPVDKEVIKNAILEEDVASTLRYLSSDELEGRETGTEGIEKAAQYIEGVFEEHGLKSFFDTYRHDFTIQEIPGFNLVGMVEGTDSQLKDEFIIIGAHYDHVGREKAVDGDEIANGANDNASGTTAVLELVKYFAARPPKRSILFTLFSAEEMGLVGAKELAKSLKAEGIDLYTMLNIEMIGVPMEGRAYKAYLTGYETSNMAERFNEYTGENVLGFLPQAKQYKLFQRSDNFPFYNEFKIPAQTVSTFDFTNYPYYHHVDDEFEHMDTVHMEELIESIIPGIIKMANTAEKEIKLKQ